MSETPYSYDEVPYHSVSLVETHPERAATVARLFGLNPPDVATARVLELGCAGGGNLVPLAAILPDATFVGVDLSPRQIEQAEALAREAGTSNVTFQTLSLTDLHKDFGEFDYIICHGVYSWVPDDVKAAVLRICSENLSPEGVSYVSFNTFPGWHVPGMIREMMLYHVREMTDPNLRVKAARAFLEFLGTHVPEKEGHFAKILRDEAVQLRPHGDPYVLHEHLEAINEPIYFHEFADRVAAHGLKYLGDSRFWTMATSVQPAMAGVLDMVSRDPIAREQYFDFLCNRRFRRTLLCHADRQTLPLPTQEQIKGLRASALVWPTALPVDLGTKTKVDFRAGDGMIRLSTIEPLFKAALVILNEVHPRSLPFDELWNLVRTRLQSVGVEPGTSPDILAQRLLQAHAANSVELHTFEPAMATTISERPRAFPLARLAASQAHQVPNLRHRQITLTDFERLVIRQLDGERTLDEIVPRLVEAVQNDEFTIQQNGFAVKDETIVGPILRRSLEPALERLIRASLIVS